MRNRNHSALRQVLGITAVLVLLTGCMPTIGRTNAHIERGWDLNAVGAAYVYTGVTNDQGEKPKDDDAGLLYLEAQLQYGMQAAYDASFAVQLKVPILFHLSSFDMYYEVPSAHPNFFGFGAEAGLMASSLYLVYTHYFGDSVFVTMTPRIHYQYVLDDMDDDLYGTRDQNHDGWDHVWLNPQVSLGLRQEDGLTEFFAFAAYNHYLTDMEFGFCWDSPDCDEIATHAKGLWMSGIGLHY